MVVVLFLCLLDETVSPNSRFLQKSPKSIKSDQEFDFHKHLFNHNCKLDYSFNDNNKNKDPFIGIFCLYCVL